LRGGRSALSRCIIPVLILLHFGAERNLVHAGLKAPRAEFASRVSHLDTMVQGEIKTALFALRNAGNDILRIDRTVADCGCAIAVLSRNDIPPESSAAIEIAFNSAQFRGARESRLLIYSNDPVRPVDTLTLHAYVKTELDCSPRNLFFADVPHGQRLMRPILLFNTSAIPIRVLSMKPQDEYVNVDWRRPRTINPGDTIPVGITVDPPDTLRRFSTSIALQVDREQSQPFSIRVYGFFRE